MTGLLFGIHADYDIWFIQRHSFHYKHTWDETSKCRLDE